jgi:hypothetical protein
MRKFLTSGRRRYALAIVVLAASLGVMGAQCAPTKEPVKEPPPPPPPPTLTVAPSEIDFGDVKADGVNGAQRGVLMSVMNDGSAPTTLDFGLSSSHFRLSFAPNPGACSAFTGFAQLGPREACFLDVVFDPLLVGPIEGTLVVTGNPGGSVTVPLRGNGIP